MDCRYHLLRSGRCPHETSIDLTDIVVVGFLRWKNARHRRGSVELPTRVVSVDLERELKVDVVPSYADGSYCLISTKLLLLLHMLFSRLN